MNDPIKIFPDIEILRLISITSYDLDELPYLTVQNSINESIKTFIAKYSIKIKADNMCYIYLLAKGEKSNFSTQELLKQNEMDIDKDLAGFTEYFRKSNEYSINKISLTATPKEANKPNKNISIRNPRVINEVLNLLSIYYGSTKLTPELIKKNRQLNQPSFSRKVFAQKIEYYLSKFPGISKNERLLSIGFIFQLSGIDPHLSEKEYNNKKETGFSSYKSYPDYVKTTMRGKYFQ